MNTNAIFLDIDGVAQSYRVMLSNGWECYCGGNYVKESFDQVAVAFLNLLAKKVGADIILNSTWAHRMTDAKLKRLSEVTGLTFSGFVPDDVSETMPFGRERRCKQYLAERPHYTKYIFIDDESGHYLDFLSKFVYANPEDGLTYKTMGVICDRFGVDIGSLRDVE